MANTAAMTTARRMMRSFHGDLDLLGCGVAVVAGPPEFDGAALGGDRVEGDERVGGNRWMQLGAENLLAVVGGDEVRDDVARDDGPHVGIAEPRLHRMRDQRLDSDDFAALGPGGDLDECASA